MSGAFIYYKLQRALAIFIIVVGATVLLKSFSSLISLQGFGFKDSVQRSTTSSLYTGPSWSNERTLSRKVIFDTRFARCELHKVRTEDGSATINDWLWFDEKDAVNVVVKDLNGKLIFMRQKKYGLTGTTLSPVGGMIDDGETAFEAAKREVLEELGMGSRRTQQSMKDSEGLHQKHQTRSSFSDQGGQDGSVPPDEPDWHYFGVYRTAANRGGGMSHLYLLDNAVPLLPGGGTSSFRSSGDNEEQEILLMTMDQTRDALYNAEFKEIKWAATVSFSLLHLHGRS
jgi:8-oxo-dGTP pyrophosphatase MutT (NUDIX family)